MSQDKAKLIEILSEGMGLRSITCDANCCIYGFYPTDLAWQEALEFYTPVILALGLSIDDFPNDWCA